MKLIYVYHSGFLIESDDCVIVIDYYKDSGREGREGVVHKYLEDSQKKFYVLASHAHADHFNPEILCWEEQKPDLLYIFSADIRGKVAEKERNIVWLEKGESWNDLLLSIKAYGSTDTGISFLIDLEGKRIFHAGDLNNWHWKEESNPEEVREAESAYKRELEMLANEVESLDLVMFPVDPRLGKEYMKGAEQLVDRIPVRSFVPMHFWEQYEKADAFREYAERKGVRFVSLNYPGEHIVF